MQRSRCSGRRSGGLFSSLPFLSFALAAAALAAACGQEEPMTPPDVTDPSASLFDPDWILEVTIELDPADWEALRVQTRDALEMLDGDCMTDPLGVPRPFTYFPATVTVAGERREKVGVRKKGFLGSLDEERPSLKVKFDEYVEGGALLGLDRLTLNNNKSDPSGVHQCIAYRTFAAAGVPAPRCSFAHVTVNGEDLGLYSNVESVKKRFLRRHFDAEDGNLYEGTGSDFRPVWVNTFEKKTNRTDPNRSDLDQVVTALAASDTSLLDALDAVVDVDGFLSFWATEVLLEHSDGYANSTNNFFVYADPTDGRFVFMPWGADDIMAPDPFVDPAAPPRPTSVYAAGAVARRLYLHPEGQTRYLERLREVLETAWDEAALLAEIDRMEALITPVVEAHTGDVGELALMLDDVRDFVETRRSAILDEIDAGAPAWTEPPRDEFCFDVVGEIDGTFSTTFGTLAAPDPFSAGTGTLAGTVEGMPLAPGMVGAIAGFDPNVPVSPQATVAIIASLPDDTYYVVFVAVDPAAFVSGALLPLAWFDLVGGGVAHYDPVTDTSTEVGGFVFLDFEATLQLDEADTTSGAPVSGSFHGRLVRF